MKNISVENLINEIPCFSILTDEEKLLVQNSSYIVGYDAGETLFRQDSPISHIMYVQSGLIKIFNRGRDEKSIIFGLVTPGNFVTLLNLAGQELYSCNATVVEKAEVLLTDISVFRKLIKSNGEFAVRVIEQTGAEGLDIISRFINQFQKQLPGRVADMLLFFSENIYKSQSFTLPLSRRELAELTGTTKESMIRTLAEFRHDKIIKIDGKEVEIISPNIIRTLSRLG